DLRGELSMTIVNAPLDGDAAKALQMLVAARASGEPCPPVRGLLPDEDVEAAYAVQSSWVADQIAAGARVVGRKIGLTNPAVQAQFGVDRPDFGVLFESMACAPGTPIDAARTLQPKIEAEIAFVLAEDLTGAMIGPAEVAAATAYVVAALEIVDSRIAGWDIGIVDTIADNGSSGLFVLGDRRQGLGRLDLAECAMTLRRVGAGQGRAGGVGGSGGEVGEVVSTGTGASILGHPLAAVAWLAAAVRDHGRPLRAGEVVLSGSLGPMVAVAPGDAFQADISGVGHVSCVFAGGTS
ncbi:MAG TPA: fumarylacetoacetate hydrolase family protein, partial [Streptosporangiaceae bacterium]|nr:fumarylacetoacetate hydrolase family protein [Streptosporangiaceae bacterium]